MAMRENPTLSASQLPSGDYCEDDDLENLAATINDSSAEELREVRMAQRQMQNQLDQLEKMMKRQFEHVLSALGQSGTGHPSQYWNTQMPPQHAGETSNLMHPGEQMQPLA